MLRMWKDALLAELVSINSTFVNPLVVAGINGDTGETKHGEFYLAVEQAELAADIEDTEQTVIELDQPMFFSANYPIVIVGSEKMLITDGHGTDTLTVQRAYNGTTPSTHSAGARVRAAYTATDITITSVDLNGSDESDWLTFRDYEDGEYESPHAVADIDFDGSERIQFEVDVPEWPSAYKRDLSPRINCKLAEIANP